MARGVRRNAKATRCLSEFDMSSQACKRSCVSAWSTLLISAVLSLSSRSEKALNEDEGDFVNVSNNWVAFSDSVAFAAFFFPFFFVESSVFPFAAKTASTDEARCCKLVVLEFFFLPEAAESVLFPFSERACSTDITDARCCRLVALALFFLPLVVLSTLFPFSAKACSTDTARCCMLTPWPHVACRSSTCPPRHSGDPECWIGGLC